MLAGTILSPPPTASSYRYSWWRTYTFSRVATWSNDECICWKPFTWLTKLSNDCHMTVTWLSHFQLQFLVAEQIFSYRILQQHGCLEPIHKQLWAWDQLQVDEATVGVIRFLCPWLPCTSNLNQMFNTSTWVIASQVPIEVFPPVTSNCGFNSTRP